MGEIIVKDGGILKGIVIPKGVTVNVKGMYTAIIDCEFR